MTTRSPDPAHLKVPEYFATGRGVAHRLEKLRAAKESMTVRMSYLFVFSKDECPGRKSVGMQKRRV